MRFLYLAICDFFSCIFHPALFFRTRTARGGHAASLILVSVSGFHNGLHLNSPRKRLENAAKRGHTRKDGDIISNQLAFYFIFFLLIAILFLFFFFFKLYSSAIFFFLFFLLESARDKDFLTIKCPLCPLRVRRAKQKRMYLIAACVRATPLVLRP